MRQRLTQDQGGGSGHRQSHVAHLCWLSNLLANRLPLVVLILLDRIEQGLALGRGSIVSILSRVPPAQG